MKHCEWCNTEYTPKRRDSRFCSNDHYTTCNYCDKEILIKSMKRIPEYCSGGCSAKAHREIKNYDCVCQLCGKSFKAQKSTDKFCGDVHNKECVVCGREFAVSPYNSTTKTCSKKCAAGITDFKARNKKAKATVLERYGVENVSQSDEVKAKKQATVLQNYGVTNPSLSEEIKQRRVLTNIERYGVDNVFKNAEIKEKIAKTNIERYGSANPFGSKTVQETIKHSMLDKYGVENIFTHPDVKAKAAQTNRSIISKVNRQWREMLLKELGVKFEFEVRFGGSYYADLGYGDILVDINPTVTHNSSYAYAHFFRYCVAEECGKHTPLSRLYHQERALAAERDGKQLLQYFDWMNPEIFLSILASKLRCCPNRAYARSVTLRVITQAQANSFLRENHLSGASSGQSVCLGLFNGEELVHVQSYGPARMNKNYQWEAIRSCSKIGWQVQGAFSKCDKYFFTHYAPDSMISYVDLSISSGATELSFPGWSLLAQNKPSATWVKMFDRGDGKPLFVRDSAARRVSADRLLGFEVGDKYPVVHADGSKVTNDFVLLSEGYVKVYDAGTRSFVWMAS